MQNLILASSSIYRQRMLGKIIHDFQWVKPNFEENHCITSSTGALAIDLAKGKALSVADKDPIYRQPGTTIIGCDQICWLGPEDSRKRGGNEQTERKTDESVRILHKPGNLEDAVDSLMACRGKRVCYECGIHIISYPIETGSPDRTQSLSFSDAYWLQFREFSEEEARRYCELDEPYDCAGAIKTESLGIRLIAKHEGEDPHTLQGLPLIKLREALLRLGLSLD